MQSEQQTSKSNEPEQIKKLIRRIQCEGEYVKSDPRLVISGNMTWISDKQGNVYLQNKIG